MSQLCFFSFQVLPSNSHTNFRFNTIAMRIINFDLNHLRASMILYPFTYSILITIILVLQFSNKL